MKYNLTNLSSRSLLEEIQLERIQKTVDYCYNYVSFYRKKLSSVGITSGKQIASLKDISKIPFTTKEDLAELYPYGLLAISKEDVVELHESSGSTGVPKVIAYSDSDRKNWGEAIARLYSLCGITRFDIIQNATPYGMFTGGFGCHYGASALGCCVLPASGGNTVNQLNMISYYGTTALTCTSSYALHLAEELQKEPGKYDVSTLKKMWVGGEACTESMRRRIEETLGCDVYNSYGLTEIWGPGFSGECTSKNGLHINEDIFYHEIISVDSQEVVQEGNVGELVVTSLLAEGMPILRYRTNDLTRIIPSSCECGCILRKIEPPRARLDDMIIIRGVNVYPFQIKNILDSFSGTSDQYQIELRRENGCDIAVLRIEYPQGYTVNQHNESLEEEIERCIKQKLKIHINVQFIPFGSLSRDSIKMKRVLDLRYGG